jgi:tetratricopeptide (TPR) repeat protein
MPLDREKTYKNAERLLRQQKTQEALRELRRLADDAPRDLLMLNRIGDLLVRMGRNAEAIGYYQGIAEQFTEAGFFVKAIAILKKILRLDPESTESIVRMGELYLKQKLPSEARQHLLHAADKHLRAKQFTKAREVYEKVVLAEPMEPLHRARLAEARAAEGDAERACQDLIELGAWFLSAGRVEEASRTFRRAGQIVPGRIEAVSGLASCLMAEGKADEAIRTLEEAIAAAEDKTVALGELALLYEQAGRTHETDRLLAEPEAEGIPDAALEKILRHHHTAGRAEWGWARIDPLLAKLAQSGSRERVPPFLKRAADIEPQGHIPALQRLFELHRDEENRPGMAWVLERLVAAYRSRSMHDEASLMYDQLRQIEPPGRRAPADATEARARAAAEAASSDVERAPKGPGAVPLEGAAPAVPMGPADDEFVSSHLTEAEVFEKYGLVAEALQQLRQVTEKFPGHVAAQERLAALVGSQGERDTLKGVLVDLAVARRAAGKIAEAKDAARGAAEIGSLEPAARKLLESLALLAPVAAAPELGEEDAETSIVFEDEETAPAETAPPARAPAPGERMPPAEVVEEIEFFLQQGMVEDARKKLAALETLGFGGPTLAQMAARAAELAPVGDVEVEVEVEAASEGSGPPVFAPDDADLGAMIQSLEDELATEPVPVAATPTTFDQQSVGEVFEAFKQHVQAEIGSEDFRTHYDLGIAYKEMGLLDDALEEFRAAMGSPDLVSDACSMLAICHRERGETDEAVKWYREALSQREDQDAAVCGLRYDLAETLLEAGDSEAALDLFRNVLESDPSYRDVRARVEELSARRS